MTSQATFAARYRRARRAARQTVSRFAIGCAGVVAVVLVLGVGG